MVHLKLAVVGDTAVTRVGDMGHALVIMIHSANKDSVSESETFSMRCVQGH